MSWLDNEKKIPVEAAVTKTAPIAPQEDPITRIINTVNGLPPVSKLKMNQVISKLEQTFHPSTNRTDAPRAPQEREKY